MATVRIMITDTVEENEDDDGIDFMVDFGEDGEDDTPAQAVGKMLANFFLFLYEKDISDIEDTNE